MTTPLEDIKPPKFADRFLAWFCNGKLLEEVKGDLHESYRIERKQKGEWRANIIYWYEVFQFLRPFALKRKSQNSNKVIMYRSYLKFAWRNMLKNTGIFTLNVLSLGVGIACFIFIFVYLKGELSYDKFHDDADRIYRVAIDFVDSNQRRLPDATTPPALAPALKRDFPEVGSSARIFPNWGHKFLLGTSGDKKFYEEGLIRTDSTFFDIFSFPMIYGNAEKALDYPDQMVITRKAARKYFGKENVVGETIIIYGNPDKTYRISGVLEDVPVYSHFKFDFLIRIPFEGLEQNWGQYNYYTYMKLLPGADIEKLEPRLQPFFEGYQPERKYHNIIYSQPLTDIHLKSNLKWELETNGDINNVYVFVLLAIFILVISCINYLNLTIAESFKRFKEVGVRKVFGAHKKSLIGQFMVENLLVISISMILGSILSELFFKNLDGILQQEISLLDPENLGIFLGICLVVLAVGTVAGLFPAMHLSSFKAALAVKGIFNHSGSSGSSLRRGLLIVQFAISAFMIFGTIVVYKQLQHVKNADKGFKPEQVLVIGNMTSVQKQEALKVELLKIAGISGASLSNGIIGGLNWTRGLGYPDAFTMNLLDIDPEFIETMGLEFVAGRNFSRERPTDAQGLTIVVNETGLRELGMTYEDVGKSMPMDTDNDSILLDGKVIGVVKDFHFTDFKKEIKPFAFFYREHPMNYLSLRVSTVNLSKTLTEIERVWSDVANGIPLEYSFLDQTFADLHAREQKLSRILSYLTFLAIFIAFMGMFAIANMTVKDRIREIAIRKILGASVSGISNMITKKFLLLVLIANIIACPAAYLVMQRWLEGFVYRTSLGLTLFLVAIGSTLLVTWTTVGIHAFRAAFSNPIQNLRQE